jgi:hypothetical protein
MGGDVVDAGQEGCGNRGDRAPPCKASDVVIYAGYVGLRFLPV